LLKQEKKYKGLRIGCYAQGICATATLVVAKHNSAIDALVLKNARTDMANHILNEVKTPVLLMVDRDNNYVKINYVAEDKLSGIRQMELIKQDGTEGSSNHPPKDCIFTSNWFEMHLQPIELFN
jgi:hypothetical protein